LTKNRRKTKPIVRMAYIDPATPETRGKLKEGTMARLIASRRIGGEEVMAAQEIERVWCALCCRLFAKAGHYGERLDPSADRDWSPGMLAAHVRYLAWANSLKGQTLSIVIDILIDNRAARDIDRERRWKSGTTLDLLIATLGDYAAKAGWRKARTRTA
jgi:hypothetical protein